MDGRKHLWRRRSLHAEPSKDGRYHGFRIWIPLRTSTRPSSASGSSCPHAGDRTLLPRHTTSTSTSTTYGGFSGTSQSTTTRTVNGRTETVTRTVDANGNVTVHTSAPEGSSFTSTECDSKTILYYRTARILILSYNQLPDQQCPTTQEQGPPTIPSFSTQNDDDCVLIIHILRIPTSTL